MADVELFAVGGRTHATNVVLHAANSVLLFWFLASATGSPGGVDSSPLSSLFIRSTSNRWRGSRAEGRPVRVLLDVHVLAYLRYVRRPSVLRYVAVVACFAFAWQRGDDRDAAVPVAAIGLLAPPAVLRRGEEGGCPSGKRAWISREGSPGGDVGVRVMDDAAGPRRSLEPSGVRSSSPVEPGSECRPVRRRLPRESRLASSLAVFYPTPMALRGLEAALRRLSSWRQPCWPEGTRPASYLLTGWLWYLGRWSRCSASCRPAPRPWRIGILCAADRCVHRRRLGRPDLFRPSRWKDPLLAGLAAPYCSPCRGRVGPDGELAEQRHLFSHAVSVTRDNWLAQMNLGGGAGEEGRTEEEIGRYREADPHRPAYPEAHTHLGAGPRQKGDLDGAIESYRRSLALWPGNPQAALNLGCSGGKGRHGGRRAALPRGAAAPARTSRWRTNNLGTLLALQGRLPRRSRTSGRRCGFPLGFHGAPQPGAALLRDGKREEAAEQFRRRYGCAPGSSAGKCWRPPWPRSGSNHGAPRAAGETTLAGPAGRTRVRHYEGDGQLAQHPFRDPERLRKGGRGCHPHRLHVLRREGGNQDHRGRRGPSSGRRAPSARRSGSFARSSRSSVSGPHGGTGEEIGAPEAVRALGEQDQHPPRSWRGSVVQRLWTGPARRVPGRLREPRFPPWFPPWGPGYAGTELRANYQIYGQTAHRRPDEGPRLRVILVSSLTPETWRRWG